MNSPAHQQPVQQVQETHQADQRSRWSFAAQPR
jgi:hypothetical protein